MKCPGCESRQLRFVGFSERDGKTEIWECLTCEHYWDRDELIDEPGDEPGDDDEVDDDEDYVDSDDDDLEWTNMADAGLIELPKCYPDDPIWVEIEHGDDSEVN